MPYPSSPSESKLFKEFLLRYSLLLPVPEWKKTNCLTRPKWSFQGWITVWLRYFR
jgi:hypothetical protein